MPTAPGFRWYILTRRERAVPPVLRIPGRVPEWSTLKNMALTEVAPYVRLGRHLAAAASAEFLGHVYLPSRRLQHLAHQTRIQQPASVEPGLILVGALGRHLDHI